MERALRQLQSEIDMLKQSVAEEQKQKYAAYKRIEELKKELDGLLKGDESKKEE